MLIHTENYSFEGKEYQIRVESIQDGYRVRAYLDGKPANGYMYSADEITGLDMRMSHGISVWFHLINLAKSDIENRIWDQYLEALKNRQ